MVQGCAASEQIVNSARNAIRAAVVTLEQVIIHHVVILYLLRRSNVRMGAPLVQLHSGKLESYWFLKYYCYCGYGHARQHG